MDDIKCLVGKRVRALRKEKGLTQEELGWRAELHYTYIGAVERGEKNCSLETLDKISKALSVNIHASSGDTILNYLRVRVTPYLIIASKMQLTPC